MDRSKPGGALLSNEPRIGEVLADKYELREIIGRGGFGVVYEALHLGINRKIALKVLLPEFMDKDPDLAIRFRREALLASQLRHPNTITLYDYGQHTNGLLYMAMEHVDGDTLSVVLRDEAPIEGQRCIHIARQILGSLHEAHQRGIIHRDLKPGNIMLTRLRGDKDFVKVLDFGIAKAISSDLLAQPDMGQTLTQEGRFCGTPRYMAPEQFRNTPVSPAVDLYSLGLICYELLTGKPAVTGETMVDLIVAQVTGTDLFIPAEVGLLEHSRKALDRALRKNPSERFTSAAEFLSDLDEPSTSDSLPDLDYLGTELADEVGDDYTVELPPNLNPFTRRPEERHQRTSSSEVLTNPAIASRAATTESGSGLQASTGRTDSVSSLKSKLRSLRERQGRGTDGVKEDRIAPLGSPQSEGLSVARSSVQPIARLRRPANTGPYEPPPSASGSFDVDMDLDEGAEEEEFDTMPVSPQLQQRALSAAMAAQSRGVSTQNRRPLADLEHSQTNFDTPAIRPDPFADDMPDATVELTPDEGFNTIRAMMQAAGDDGEATIDIAASDLLTEHLKSDFHKHLQRNNEPSPQVGRPNRRPKGPSANPSAFIGGGDEFAEEDGPTVRVTAENAREAMDLARRQAESRRDTVTMGSVSGKRKFPIVPVALAGVVALLLSAGCVFGVAHYWDAIAAPQNPSTTDADTAGRSPFVKIDVVTDPQGATLFVNQQKKGITPRKFDCPRDGNVTITLKKKGFATMTDQLRCAKTATRDYTLTPE